MKMERCGGIILGYKDNFEEDAVESHKRFGPVDNI
jgi:hypothetical protein